MKKLVSVILFILLACTSGLFAQNKLTVVGGLNFGTIKYNNSDVEELIDVSAKTGLMIGAETETGPLKVGCAFVQRGTELAMDNYFGDVSSSVTFNYIDVYALFPVSLNKQISAFGGLELGHCLGGEEKMKENGYTETFTFDAKDFKTEIGIKFGVDFMLSPKVGFRGSYYLGISDVWNFDGITSSQNIRNRGIGLNILYKG